MRFSDRLDAGRVPLTAFELAAAPIAALAGLVVLVFVWGAIATTRLVGDVLSVGESGVGAMIALVVLALAALLLTAASWIVAAYRRYFAHPDRGRNPAAVVAAPLVGVAVPLAYGLVTYGLASTPWWLLAFVVASVHVVTFRAVALYSARSGDPRSGVLAGVLASVPVTVLVVTSVTERILDRAAGDAAGAGRVLAEAYALPGVPPNRLLVVTAPLLVALLYGPVRASATTRGTAAASDLAATAADSIRSGVARLRPADGSGPHLEQSRPTEPPVSARRSSSGSSGGSNRSASSNSGTAGDGGVDRSVSSSSSGPSDAGREAGSSASASSSASGSSGGPSGSSARSSGSSDATSGASSASDSASDSASSGGAAAADASAGSAGDEPPSGEPLVEGAESETQIFTGDFQEYEQESDSVETCPACEEDIPSDGVYNFCPFCAEEL